jgi:hypothetical protein
MKKFALVSIVLVVFGAISGWAQTPESERGPRLNAVISRVWLEGASPELCRELEGLASGTVDALWAKAQFHLACAEATLGNRPAALQCLGLLEKASGVPEAEKSAAALRKLLVEPGKGPRSMTLDVHEKPIEEVIRLAARETNRAVIIDSGLARKRVTLHIPKTDFDQVMKILAQIGGFDMKPIGDILLVTPGNSSAAPVGKDGRVRLDLRDTDIRDALKMTAQMGGMNVILHKNVSGKITIRLNEVPAFDALKMIARACDLHIEKEGETYLVMHQGDRERLTGQADFAQVPLKYLDPNDAAILVRHEKLSLVQPTAGGRGLDLRGDPSTIARVREFLGRQDKPHAPIQLSAKLWEIGKREGYSIESFQKQTGEEKEAQAKLISAPRIITTIGKAALISMESQGEGGLGFDLSLSFKPAEVDENLFRLEIDNRITSRVASGSTKQEQKRNWNSTFVVKKGAVFCYEIQSGERPLVMELTLTDAQ